MTNLYPEKPLFFMLKNNSTFRLEITRLVDLFLDRGLPFSGRELADQEQEGVRGQGLPLHQP